MNETNDTPIRTKQQIDAEYSELAMRAGDLEYRLKTIPKNMRLDLDKIYQRMVALNNEAVAVQSAPSQPAAS